jgi:2-C-methyl-D-erythritol 4-phosphate cytidylyltransferase
MTRSAGAAIHALVMCAGRGARSGAELPKQYVAVAGKAVVAHTLEAIGAVDRLASILVVLAPDDDAFERHVRVAPTGESRLGAAAARRAPRASPTACRRCALQGRVTTTGRSSTMRRAV